MIFGFQIKLEYLITTGEIAKKKAEINPTDLENHLLPIKYNIYIVKIFKRAIKTAGPIGLKLEIKRAGEIK